MILEYSDIIEHLKTDIENKLQPNSQELIELIRLVETLLEAQNIAYVRPRFFHPSYSTFGDIPIGPYNFKQKLEEEKTEFMKQYLEKQFDLAKITSRLEEENSLLKARLKAIKATVNEDEGE